jgi:hypothetical protein
MTSIRERIAHALFPQGRPRLRRKGRGDVIQRAALKRGPAAGGKAINAAITVTVDDSKGWDPLAGGGPHDRSWSELKDDLDDALEAWRKNFMIRRIVTLTRSYVVGNGITVSSKNRSVAKFLESFWTHPKNRMDQRLGPMCDELTRAGELFPVLFTNKADGMSYIRFIPAARIREIETDPDDYEKELRYGQIQDATAELKWWISPNDPAALKPARRQLPPVMLHFAVNRPIGATRGESDLATVLKWALRYSNWLEDRVRLNRIRTRSGMLDIEIADDSMVEQKKYQLRQDQPLTAGIYIHGPGEKSQLHNLNIQADDAEPDGKALRLAIAAGSATALHYLGEGGDVNYATAKEMGEPTARFHTERQEQLTNFLVDIASLAYWRYQAVTGSRAPAGRDLLIETAATEVARADNQTLASAAKDVVTALAQMRAQGWIDDTNAVRLAFKFAGEAIDQDEIAAILEAAQPADPTVGDTPRGDPEEEQE